MTQRGTKKNLIWGYFYLQCEHEFTEIYTVQAALFFLFWCVIQYLHISSFAKNYVSFIAPEITASTSFHVIMHCETIMLGLELNL